MFNITDANVGLSISWLVSAPVWSRHSWFPEDESLLHFLHFLTLAKFSQSEIYLHLQHEPALNLVNIQYSGLYDASTLMPPWWHFHVLLKITSNRVSFSTWTLFFIFIWKKSLISLFSHNNNICLSEVKTNTLSGHVWRCTITQQIKLKPVS